MKYAVLLLLIAFSCKVESSFAQKFNGIECGKPLNETTAAFVAKGFVKQGNLDKDSKTTVFDGVINGKKHSVILVSTPKTKIVWKFAVILPKSYSWSSAKSEYLKYKEIFIGKYSEPVEDYNTFESPYEEGDGSEMLALKNEKCNYSCYFNDIEGNVLFILLNSISYGEANVWLHYQNKIATELNSIETSEIEQNIY